MRRFKLIRKEDVSKISGTGYVAEGCLFKDGHCVLVWKSNHSSVNVYSSVEDILFVHGHGGATKIEWIDDEQHDF
jgi:hypothetical protein